MHKFGNGIGGIMPQAAQAVIASPVNDAQMLAVLAAMLFPGIGTVEESVEKAVEILHRSVKAVPELSKRIRAQED